MPEPPCLKGISAATEYYHVIEFEDCLLLACVLWVAVEALCILLGLCLQMSQNQKEGVRRCVGKPQCGIGAIIAAPF